MRGVKEWRVDKSSDVRSGGEESEAVTRRVMSGVEEWRGTM